MFFFTYCSKQSTTAKAKAESAESRVRKNGFVNDGWMDGWAVFCPDKCKKQPKRKEEGLLQSHGFSSICMLFFSWHRAWRREAQDPLLCWSTSQVIITSSIYACIFVCKFLCSAFYVVFRVSLLFVLPTQNLMPLCL